MVKGKAKTFEARMQRLQEIVTALEKGDISLEESVQLYKEGTQLSLQCREQLAKARHDITICGGAAADTPFTPVHTGDTPDTEHDGDF